MTGVQLLVVDADAHEQRFDRWVRRQFPQLKQGQIEKLCRKGEFRLDGARLRANTRLQSGQQVRVPPMPDDFGQPQSTSAQAVVSNTDRDMLRAAVIFKDDHLIALNKPAGLPVQGGSKQTRHLDGLSSALVNAGDAKPKLVHRLDRDTSGVIVLARSAQAAKGLAYAFKSRQTRKIYWAAVAGVPKPAMGTIRYGLVKMAGHGPNQAGEKMRIIHPDQVEQMPGAKHATTDYRVIDGLGTRAAWVALVPVTGRTHQLRAHMAALGNPIVGDGKYGGNAQVNMGDGWGAQLGGDISRKLHLHARRLTIQHPITGATLNLSAPLPDHMQKTWAAFDWDITAVPSDPFNMDQI